MWQSYIQFIEQGLLFLNQVIDYLGIPYSFGFAIILFTVTVKALTYPLNVKQIKASHAMQALQPKLKALQAKLSNDREAMAQAQMALYKEHGVNPLGGCLPTLVQMPIWIGLYQALFALSILPDSPLNEGFFWIPSLMGPVGTTGRDIGWLLPSSDHFLGWSQAIAYLIIPVILVVTQIYNQRMMVPQTDNEQQKTMSQMMGLMPLMFGYFSLVVPSGLSLYWISSNLLGLLQHRLMRKHKQVEMPAVADVASASAHQKVDVSTAMNGTAATQPQQTPSKRRRRAKKKSKRRSGH